MSVEDESVTNKCKRRTNAMAHSFSNSRVDMPFLILPVASRRQWLNELEGRDSLTPCVSHRPPPPSLGFVRSPIFLPTPWCSDYLLSPEVY